MQPYQLIIGAAIAGSLLGVATGLPQRAIAAPAQTPPAAVMQRWAIVMTKDFSQVQPMAAGGWEPFAVTVDRGRYVWHFRRKL